MDPLNQTCKCFQAHPVARTSMTRESKFMLIFSDVGHPTFSLNHWSKIHENSWLRRMTVFRPQENGCGYQIDWHLQTFAARPAEKLLDGEELFYHHDVTGLGGTNMCCWKYGGSGCLGVKISQVDWLIGWLATHQLTWSSLLSKSGCACSPAIVSGNIHLSKRSIWTHPTDPNSDFPKYLSLLLLVPKKIHVGLFPLIEPFSRSLWKASTERVLSVNGIFLMRLRLSSA